MAATLLVARGSSRFLPRLSLRGFATRTLSLRQRAHTSQHIPPQPPDSSKRLQNVWSPSNEPAEANQTTKEISQVEAVSTTLAQIPDSENNLVTPVYMPEDPNGILKETHPVMKLLDNSTLVIQRQLELMNVLVGFEQANRYVIMDPHGNHIGYLAERDHGIGSTITRQMFKTHRSFTTHVFDREEREVLRFHRPFAWISSRIRIYDAVGNDNSPYTSPDTLQSTGPGSIATHTSAQLSNLPLSDMKIIGSAEQEWAPLRRKYNLFLARNIEDDAATSGTPQLSSGDLPLSNSKALQISEGDSREVGMVQFARVDEPFLSWDFSLMAEDGRLIGSVNKNFAGFAREIFTDMGVYALRMDSVGSTTSPDKPSPLIREAHPGMTLDQRAVMLATAVSVDFDYFSRHSGGVGGVGMWPLWMPWGGEAAGGAAAAGEAGAVGAAAGETGIASEVGAAARGMGASEGAIAGAGTMAGYEAMRPKAREQENDIDDQSPQAGDHSSYAQDEEVWGQGKDPMGGDNDFWGGGGMSGRQGGNQSGGNSGADGGGGGSGDGGGFDFSDWF